MEQKNAIVKAISQTIQSKMVSMFPKTKLHNVLSHAVAYRDTPNVYFIDVVHKTARAAAADQQPTINAFCRKLYAALFRASKSYTENAMQDGKIFEKCGLRTILDELINHVDTSAARLAHQYLPSGSELVVGM